MRPNAVSLVRRRRRVEVQSSIVDSRAPRHHPALLPLIQRLRDAYVLQGWAPDNGNSNDAYIDPVAQRGLNSVPGADTNTTTAGTCCSANPGRRTIRHSAPSPIANVFKPLGMTGRLLQSRSRQDRSGSRRLFPAATAGVSRRKARATAGSAEDDGERAGLLLGEQLCRARVGTPALLARMQTRQPCWRRRPPSAMGFGIGNYRGARTFRTSGGRCRSVTELSSIPIRTRHRGAVQHGFGRHGWVGNGQSGHSTMAWPTSSSTTCSTTLGAGPQRVASRARGTGAPPRP